MKKVEAKNLLKNLQSSYLRAVMNRSHEIHFNRGARSDPLFTSGSAYHLFNQTAYRLKCQGEWRDAGLDHTRLGVFQKYPFTEKQDRIYKKFQLV